MEMLQPSLYQSLDEAKAEIRLLKIDSLETAFKLVTVSLNDAPDYAALSYVWGTPTDQESVIIQGQHVQIGRNLASALVRLRRPVDIQDDHSLGAQTFRRSVRSSVERILPFRTREKHPALYLWVDALCINQQDLEERAWQVQLMGRIYSSAQVVYCWIGPTDYSLAFNSLKKVAHEVRRQSQSQGVDTDKCEFQPRSLWRYPSLCMTTDLSGYFPSNKAWTSIWKLLDETYWRRVWIFQELVLARRAILIGPSDATLSWDDFDAATVSLFPLGQRLIREQRQKPFFISSMVWLKFTGVRPSVAAILVRSGRELLELRATGNQTDYITQLEWEVSSFAQAFAATDPRDYIYGLLGITQLPISPNYNGDERTVSSLYVDYFDGWLKAARVGSANLSILPLSFLSIAGAGRYCVPSDLPSWAPNFPENARSEKRGDLGPKNTFFVGVTGKYPYIISMTRSLFVWGFQLERIAHVADNSATDVIDLAVKKFLSFVNGFLARHPTYISGITPLQAIWWLMLQKPPRPANEEMAQCLQALMGLEAIYQPLLQEPKQLTEILATLDPEVLLNAFPDADLWQYFREAQSWNGRSDFSDVVRLQYLNRHTRCFESESGYLGMSYMGIAEGDYLCVFCGYDQTAVVRKSSAGHYYYVATSYVLDIDTQGLIERGKIEPQWFELR
ncbi:hypothetical protein CEP51_007487 [Fusarium floridanum]|uniref:Heterokaryon incompatibility domain-containing protein n=1 Tax=Fusarium floridanum TaxID=1325733 RepID=A0A428RP19_9HYPO|nr:hypothetical protein CEP51_007487 [Fusarium floridanum]